MDERLDLGIREFNEGRYFEAHDFLEDLWLGYREPDRDLLQALIHAAVGFYHFEAGNLKGSRSQLSKACSKMSSYLPEYWGIQLAPLYASISRQLELIDGRGQAHGASTEFSAAPRIQRIDRDAGGL